MGSPRVELVADDNSLGSGTFMQGEKNSFTKAVEESKKSLQ
jgi:hypothetical protein